MVLRFDQVDGSSGAAVGGKAANLGVLSKAQMPVPPGFCVTTDGYRLVVGQLLDEVLDQLEDAHTTEVPALAAAARERVAAAPVPEELAAEVLRSYAELGGGAVAVRSSATAEDLEGASFAGQQDTYLNVVGEDAVLDAVRRCWASLWTDRAVSYRASAGIDSRTVALAVVVQAMVQSAAAGVMFTADPVTGTRRHTVIDAGLGLGEAVVSGAVNPDHFVVDAVTSSIRERRRGDLRVLIRGLPGGGTERVDLDGSSRDAVLSDAQVLELAALGRRVQELYGAPQDIEWALDQDNRLWLTQSRPITTLYPVLERSDRAGLRVFMCMTLAQGLTRPITPMGLAAFRLLGSSVAAGAGSPVAEPRQGPSALVVAGQRVFVDFTEVLSHPIGRHAALAAFGVMEARAAAVLRGLAQTDDFRAVTGSRLSLLRRVVRVARKVRAPQSVLTAAVSPDRAYRAIEDRERQLRRDLVLPDDATPEERLEHVQRLLSERVFWFMPTGIAYPLAGFALLGLARRLLRGLLAPGELQTVLRGLPHNVTTEMDLALWRLSRELEADEPSRQAFRRHDPRLLAERFLAGGLPPAAQHGLGGFLQRYGHRAVAEIDLGMPRWSDDPTHLVGVLTNYLRHDDPALAADVQFAAGDAAARAMTDTLVARAVQRSRVRGEVVRFALRRARQLAGLREAPKNLLVLALAGLRQHLVLVGRTLVDRGLLDEAEDVFFLDLTEAADAVAGRDARALVLERRETYAAELRRRHIPRILLSDGTEPEAVRVPGAVLDGALSGSPASAGTVTAPVRVILDPVGARLEPGEILVAPSTDPGWTPLFLTAGGLVMEMGGSNSHGAVVAREYGIPAVVGVPDATTRLRSGQLVTVDGAAGSVTPHTADANHAP